MCPMQQLSADIYVPFCNMEDFNSPVRLQLHFAIAQR